MLEKFNLSHRQLFTITDRFRRDFHFGLKKDTNPKASVKMLPSYWGGLGVYLVRSDVVTQ